jgi:membrane protease YdiL (CAAX protease family)
LTDRPDSTDSSNTSPESAPTPPETGSPSAGPAEPPPGPARLGLGTFSLEGRRAPGLYLVGWLGTVLGLPIFGAAFLSGVAQTGRIILLVIGAALLGLGLVAASGAQALERRDRPDLAYRGPSPFLVFAASIPLSILVTLPIALAGADSDAPAVTLVAVLLTAAVWLGLVGSTVVGPGALSWREIAPGFSGAAPGRIAADVAVGAAGAIPVILATAILGAILVGIFGAAPEPPIQVPRDGAGLILSLIAAAVVAPISEELFYRGFATTAWARSYGPTRAIVEGALFFAFVHVLTLSGPDFGTAARSALVAFLARIPVALALGWVFLRRDSLPASIGLHATFNGLLVLLAFWASSAGGS